MSAVVTEFVGILVSGITALGSGIATGIKSFAEALFLDTTGQTTALSTFAGILAVFASLALAIGITTRIYMLLTSFAGNR